MGRLGSSSMRGPPQGHWLQVDRPFQRGQRRACDLFFLRADLHDCLYAPISWTEHLEHALVLRISSEEDGKILFIRVLYYGCIATATVIDGFMDERGNCLRAIGAYGARDPPKYWTPIQCLPDPVAHDAGTQPGSLFHFNMVTFVAKLSEACCWHSNDY